MDSLAISKSFWACVSGGKDSLFMLKIILNNPHKYKLDGVVHYELEIDYPFVKNVINYMENECIKHGIKFIRIKPRVKWIELYNKYGFPHYKKRWCNSHYKLDCMKQLKDFLKSQNKELYTYIGYCYDEKKRYDKNNKNVICPLIDFKIYENDILKWARTVKIFNNYYVGNRRCGCMLCPFLSSTGYAYLYKYYPKQFDTYISLLKKSENDYNVKTIKSDYILKNSKTKWLLKLNERERLYNERGY